MPYKQLQAAITVTQYPSKRSLPIKREVSLNENCETNESYFQLSRKELQQLCQRQLNYKLIQL